MNNKKSKKGLEMAISTIVLLVIGIVLLVVVISVVTMNWEKFMSIIKGYSGSETQNALDQCESQCSLARDYDFCCSKKTIDKKEYTCPEINASCGIMCSGVCG